jgi:ubiquinone/menaquinone biosynthesis C-methylase UbiE
MANSSNHQILAETFDRWAAAGRGAEMEIEHGDVARQVIAGMGIRAGDQILDLGCGNGWSTRLLAKAAAGAQATGIDISPAMIAEAERLHSNTIRARYAVGAFERLELPDARFQRVFSLEALYYSTDLAAALAEVLRVMKPGGALDVVIEYFAENEATAFWPEQTGVPMLRYSEEQWRAELERAGFVDIAMRRVIDSRGLGEPERFQPSLCYPSWQTWSDVHSAGFLWLHATKPR